MYFSKLSRVVFVFVLFYIFIIPHPIVLADEPAKEGVDVVLLIDTSGSMRSSDKSRNAIEAVNMFIDMLQTKYSRVSVLSFNDKISVVMDITEVNSLSDKEKIKNIVSNFEYDGFTDIGIPLLEGVNKLQANISPENSPMLLLLTDGKIEMDPERTDRNDTDSYADITQALAQASNRFPIYTIGLNYDNSVDEQLLHTISSATNGRSYIINESSALPQIFNEIFADHIESSLIEVASFSTDGEEYNEQIIDIQSDFVSEANIIILSEEELADVQLFNPNLKEVDFNQETIVYSKSKKYTIIKIITPQRGAWALKTKGVKGDRIRVNLLYQYDAAISLFVSQNGTSKTEYDSTSPIEVIGELFINGNVYREPFLYNETQATLFVERENEVVEEILLTVKDNLFFAEYTPSFTEESTFYVKAENQHFVKTSNKVSIKFQPIEIVSDSPTATEEEPTDINTDDAPVDTQMVEEEKPINEPMSKAKLASIIVIIITVVALLIVTLLFPPWRKMEKFFVGHIEIRLKDNNGKYTPMETPLLHTYVGSFTLHQFVIDNLKQQTINKIMDTTVDLKQIAFFPGIENKANVIYVTNKSKCPMYCDSDSAKEHKTEWEWKNGERLVLELGKNRKTAIIEMTYRTEEN